MILRDIVMCVYDVCVRDALSRKSFCDCGVMLQYAVLVCGVVKDTTLQADLERSSFDLYEANNRAQLLEVKEVVIQTGFLGFSALYRNLTETGGEKLDATVKAEVSKRGLSQIKKKWDPDGQGRASGARNGTVRVTV